MDVNLPLSLVGGGRVGGSGVHADAIMDRIIHNTVWVETGTYNMREHTALATA